MHLTFAEVAVGNFTEELVTTTSAPESSTSDPVVQVIDVVPHKSGTASKGQTYGGQGNKAQGQDGGEKGDENGMLGNNPPYGK